MSDFAWHGEQLWLRRAQPSDVPVLVRLHRTLVGSTPQRPDLDLPTAWFALGGPWMDAYYCERHLRHYAEVGGEVWLVVRGADDAIGTVEVWYDDEPEPFGRYGHIELLELLPEYFQAEIEGWLIDRAEATARERGYQRFWCRPYGSGGSPSLLTTRGYEPLWASSQVTLRALSQFQPPPHQLTPLRGVYAAEAAPRLALNHREAAGFRWRYLWRLLLDPGAADWPRDTLVWAAQVQLPKNEGGLCLLSLWKWYSDPLEARADLWVHPNLAANAAHTQKLLAVAAQKAVALGARSLISYLPKTLAAELQSAHIETTLLGGDDVWLMKRL